MSLALRGFEKSIITLSTGVIVKGVIVGIAPNEIHQLIWALEARRLYPGRCINR
jgi:hypothetical protein